MSRGSLDPIYLDTPYYLYPDGPVAEETLGVIGAAMAEAGVVGLGRLTLSRRERMVAVEPRGAGMALFMLRAADEVRAAQFGGVERDLDAEMIAIARAIIGQRTGSFDPTAYRDRYQEALRELIEAKMKGRTVKSREMAALPPVIDLMAALKRSLAQEAPASKRLGAASRKAPKTKPDRRQPSLCCPSAAGAMPPSAPPVRRGGVSRLDRFGEPEEALSPLRPGHSVHPDRALDVFPLRTLDAYQIAERGITRAR